MITNCPHCGYFYTNIPDHAIGKKTSCTQCQQRFVITPTSKDQPSTIPSINEWQVGDTILDHYSVRKILGQGGFGKVYLLYHKDWDINLAVKTPNTRAIEAAGGVENFEREAETWVNLGLHPNTVSCYYVRRIEGIPRVFAEYVAGGDLHDWIKTGRLYEGNDNEILARIIDIAIQFARGLHYAHEQKLIHQDVKPANLMLTEETLAKVTDFGLARARAIQGTGAAGHTMMVKGVGYTPEYASPEQLAGQKLTRRTDIWSWAVSVLEMFCGERTWRSGTIAGFHLDEYLQSGPARSGIPRMPDSLIQLLKQCFQEEPQQRPHDLGGIGEQLATIYRTITGKPYGRIEAMAGRDTADSLNNRAISLLDLGKQPDAVETWKQALNVEPYHPETTYNYGLTLWQQDLADDEPLIENLNKTLQVTQPAWLSRYLLGLVHLHRGDCKAAIEVLKPVSGHTSDDVNIDDLLNLATNNQAASRKTLVTIKDSWPVNAVSIDDSGEKILSGGQDKILSLWDAYSGDNLKSLNGHSSSIMAIQISTDGKTALSGSQNAEVKHWNLDSGKCLFTGKDHVAAITCVCFSHDDQYILSGSEDNNIRMWSATTHSFMHSFNEHQNTVTSLSINSSNDYLLSGSDDQTVKLWRLNNGQCIQTLTGHSGNVSAVDFINEHTVISSSHDQTLRIWDLHNGKCLKTITGHSAPVTAMAASKNSPFIVSGSENGMFKIWDKDNFHCLCTFNNAHRKAITAVGFSMQTGHAVSASIDKTIRLWSVKKKYDFHAPIVLSKIVSSESILSTQSEFDNELSLARQSLIGNQPAIAMQHIREARSLPGFTNVTEAMQMWRQLYAHLKQVALDSVWEHINVSGHDGVVNSVALSTNGKYVLTGGEDTTVRLWNTTDGNCEKILSGHSDSVTTVTFSACQRYAVSASKDRMLKLWDLKEDSCTRTFSGHTDHVTCITLDPNGKYLVSGSKDKSLRLWGLHTGELLHVFKGHMQPVNCCRIHYDWRYIYSGGDDKTIYVWDITTGKSLTTFGTFGGHSKRVTQICSSYDSRTLLTASEDGTLKLWDAETGNCNKTINAHTQPVTSISISIDGKYALSAGLDGYIKFWHLNQGECLHAMSAKNKHINAATLAIDMGMAASVDQDGLLSIWLFDWALTPPAKISSQDNKLKRYFDTFIHQHTPYTVYRSSYSEQSGKSHVTDITKTRSPHWNNEDLKWFQVILGYLNMGKLNIQQLGIQLHEYQKEMMVDKIEADNEQSPHDSLVKSRQQSNTLSTRIARLSLEDFISAIQRVASLGTTVFILFLIGIVFYYSTFMEYLSLQKASEYVESGQNINRPLEDGKLLLHTASSDGYIDVVRYLLDHGANIHATDTTGWTALHHAVEANEVEMVKFLLAAGADSNRGAGMKNITPMWIASQNDYREIIQAIYNAR